MRFGSGSSPAVVGLLAALLCAPFGLSSCWSADEGGSVSSGQETASAPIERLDATWPVQFATDESVTAYDKPGWTTFVMRRDYQAAIGHFAKTGGLPLARTHAEVAAMYRQGALLGAQSLIQTYGNTPEPTDPLGTAHLLSVSYAILGDLDKARAASAELGDAEDPTQVWHGPWKAWLDSGADWPPDLSGLPIELPAPAAGTWPGEGPMPHYSLPEQAGSGATRPMGDPGYLVALAMWHDAAAAAAAPEAVNALAAMRAGYRLPVEPATGPAGELGMDLLFGSDLSVSADADFLSAVHGEQGLAAVDAFADTSMIAWLAQQSRVDGRVNAERAVDVLAGYRADLIAAADAKTNGEPRMHHGQFADIAMVGAYRSLALVAELEGNREASGLLRINALDRSQKATACPVGLLALGAWDASNRYPTRAQDILHAQARRFPSLEAARYGLDVMALRVSRERPGETPGM